MSIVEIISRRRQKPLKKFKYTHIPARIQQSSQIKEDVNNNAMLYMHGDTIQ
jgi:DNA-binding helix-hairpin-helix protein with protein kinase domain